MTHIFHISKNRHGITHKNDYSVNMIQVNLVILLPVIYFPLYFYSSFLLYCHLLFYLDCSQKLAEQLFRGHPRYLSYIYITLLCIFLFCKQHCMHKKSTSNLQINVSTEMLKNRDSSLHKTFRILEFLNIKIMK